MSVFGGIVREFPHVQVDKFESSAFVAAFFLTHAHSDHMSGLTSRLLAAPVYCSAPTARLLRAHPSPALRRLRIIGLHFHRPMSIQMLDNSFLQATLLPASHCPGSAMVLLENDSQRVLCTGDFRLEGDLLANLLSSDSLRRDEHGLREISAIYLDTTFANPNWSEFPTRRESAEAVVHLIRSFPSNVQVLLRTERCGYELLWIAVSKEIGIHVTKERFRMYQALDKQEPYMLDVFGEAKVSEHLTACESDTRVFSSPCAATDDAKRRGQLAEIVPSAMFWGLAESMAHGQWRICDPGLGRATQSIKDPGMFRVLYSTHPSLSEMLDFVARLKPKRVHPIAVGNKTSPLSLKQVMSHVDFVGTLESARRRAGGSLSAGSRAIAAGPARTTDPRLGWEALALPIEPMQSSSSLARPTRHSSGGPARRVREAAIRDAKARFLAGETLRLRTTRPLRAGREAEAAGGGQ